MASELVTTDGADDVSGTGEELSPSILCGFTCSALPEASHHSLNQSRETENHEAATCLLSDVHFSPADTSQPSETADLLTTVTSYSHREEVRSLKLPSLQEQCHESLVPSQGQEDSAATTEGEEGLGNEASQRRQEKSNLALQNVHGHYHSYAYL